VNWGRGWGGTGAGSCSFDTVALRPTVVLTWIALWVEFHGVMGSNY